MFLLSAPCLGVCSCFHSLYAFVQSRSFKCYLLLTPNILSTAFDLTADLHTRVLQLCDRIAFKFICMNRTLNPGSPTQFRLAPILLVFPVPVKGLGSTLSLWLPVVLHKPYRESHCLYLQKHVLNLFLTTSVATTLIQATVVCHLDYLMLSPIPLLSLYAPYSLFPT